MTPVPIPTDQLLDHVKALRALATRLVHCGHAADDAVQDTVFQAMTGPGPRRGSVRAWLAAILRNTIAQRARGDRRRARHESRVAPGHPTPSAADAANELSQQRRLLAFVQELDEPQRHAIYLHFFRGMTAREIGAQLGVPAKTVHSRIERGLARLRARLDSRPGGRAEWVSALAPLLDLPTRAAAPTLASAILIMKSRFLACLAAIALVALLPFAAPALFGADPANAPRQQNLEVAHPRADGDVDDGGQARTEIARATGPQPGAAPVDPGPVVTGNVVNLDGQPVAGIAVVFERLTDRGAMARDRGVPAARSGPDGRFELPLPAHEGWLSTDDPAWCGVLRPWLRERVPPEPPTLVVARAQRYAGIVVDPTGQPVASARVLIDVEGLVPVRSVRGRALAMPDSLGAVETDATGHFEFARIGYVPGARIIAESEPLQPVTQELPATGTPDLRLQLGAADPKAQRLHGIVLSQGGAPLAGVCVAVGGESVRSHADGRFAAPWAWGQQPSFVRAADPRYGATQVTFATGPGLPGWRRDDPIMIRMPEEPGRVTGRVVDAAGNAQAGVRVWTPDVTYLGTVTREEKGQQLSGGCIVEAFAHDGSPAWSLATLTDRDGRFELHGLLPRSYAFFALDPESLRAAGPVTGAPGAELVLELEDSRLRRVAGQAVSGSGAPLPGLRVSIGRALSWQPPEREPDPWAGCPMRKPGAGHLFLDRFVETDEQGQFEFMALATEGSYLWFAGDSVFHAPSFRLTPELDPEALRVELPTRSTFHVELARPDEATAFRMLTETGQHRTLLVRIEGLVMSMGAVDLEDGKSPESFAKAGPATIVLLRGEDEVRRENVVLPEGRGHVLRL